MTEMTTYERVTRMYEHSEADRVPVIDYPWSSTLERWCSEGLPADVEYDEYFQLDAFAGMGDWENQIDSSPRYPAAVIEETDEYVIETTKWGTTLRDWKHHGGTPEFLDFRVKTPDDWALAKKRMTPSRDRIDWDYLKANYGAWREKGAWVSAGLWFGFDVTHSFFVGTENLLVAMAADPEWVTDMFNHFLDMNIALWEMVFDEGYRFDGIFWCDDMGYKGTQFFSLGMYRELLKPVHRRAIEWAHSRGMKATLHSCGNISAFIPELIDIGLDMLNPIEVKSGLDPVALKAEYGDVLAFHGGLNVVLYDRPEKLWDEMRRVIPAMKENGGYIASSDHSVPETVSLEDFAEFVRLAKELGSYG